MKIYFWFAVVVFVISVARPVFANPCPGGSGTNTGRYAPTASTSSSSNGNGASTTTGAAPAGIRR